MRNIVLIGFMGTGKTSVGKELARCLQRPFVDLDSLIEESTGKKIADIFSQDGEAAFRNLEQEIIHEISAKEGLVISTGGGAVLSICNVNNLKKNGLIICLSANLKTIFSRVQAQQDNRPLLANGNLMEKLQTLLAEREDLYTAAADYIVDTTEKDIKTIIREIKTILSKEKNI